MKIKREREEKKGKLPIACFTSLFGKALLILMVVCLMCHLALFRVYFSLMSIKVWGVQKVPILLKDDTFLTRLRFIDWLTHDHP